MKKISEHLRTLNGEIYTKGIKAAIRNPNYDENYKVDTVLKAWSIAVVPELLDGGLTEWCRIYDIIKEIPDNRVHVCEPMSGVEEVRLS